VPRHESVHLLLKSRFVRQVCLKRRDRAVLVIRAGGALEVKSIRTGRRSDYRFSVGTVSALSAANAKAVSPYQRPLIPVTISSLSLLCR